MSPNQTLYPHFFLHSPPLVCVFVFLPDTPFTSPLAGQRGAYRRFTYDTLGDAIQAGAALFKPPYPLYIGYTQTH